MLKNSITLVLFFTLMSISSYAFNKNLLIPDNIQSIVLLDTTKPAIVHTPIGNTPLYLWPQYISTYVTDSSGIDSVWVKWYKNSPGILSKQVKLVHTNTHFYGYFNSNNTEVSHGDTIYYRIFAQDNSVNHNIDSTSLYHFAIFDPSLIYIGNGTIPMGSASGPFNTYWYGNRTQFLVHENEIGGNGYIDKIGFYVSVVGGQPMNGFSIKMQHTTQTTLTGFTTTGWTELYSGTYTVTGTGWQYINLQNPFYYYDFNLLIEVCFGNTSYTTATTVFGTTMAGMEYSEYHDITTACTTFLAPTAQTARANICLSLHPIVGVTPNKSIIPDKYSLSQNYPNPFNPVTRINFDIPKKGFVSLKVFDILGREVQTLVNEEKTAGAYSVDFNGSEYSSGVYFYRIESGDFSDVKRMILIK
jgi:hypothetical protein